MTIEKNMTQKSILIDLLKDELKSFETKKFLCNQSIGALKKLIDNQRNTKQVEYTILMKFIDEQSNMKLYEESIRLIKNFIDELQENEQHE